MLIERPCTVGLLAVVAERDLGRTCTDRNLLAPAGRSWPPGVTASDVGAPLRRAKLVPTVRAGARPDALTTTRGAPSTAPEDGFCRGQWSPPFLLQLTQ